MSAILFAAALLAQAPEPPPVVDGYRWARKPTMAEFMRLYPRRAIRLGQGGKAPMSCKVRSDGTLRDCVIADLYGSDPAFGPATIALVGLFRMRAPEGQTLAEGGEVRIPITWQVPR